MEKQKILITFIISAVLGFSGMSFYTKNIKTAFWLQAKEENLIINPLVISSPSPSPMLSPSPTPSLKPNPSASPIISPSPSASALASPSASPEQPNFSSEQIQEFFNQYSSQYNVDINILRHIAVCESGFNPKAVNLHYAGLFQFSSSAWLKYRQRLGKDANPDLRFNAKESVETAAYVLSINEAYIWPNCLP